MLLTIKRSLHVNQSMPATHRSYSKGEARSANLWKGGHPTQWGRRVFFTDRRVGPSAEPRGVQTSAHKSSLIQHKPDTIWWWRRKGGRGSCPSSLVPRRMCVAVRYGHRPQSYPRHVYVRACVRCAKEPQPGSESGRISCSPRPAPPRGFPSLPSPAMAKQRASARAVLAVEDGSQGGGSGKSSQHTLAQGGRDPFAALSLASRLTSPGAGQALLLPMARARLALLRSLPC